MFGKKCFAAMICILSFILMFSYCKSVPRCAKCNEETVLKILCISEPEIIKPETLFDLTLPLPASYQSHGTGSVITQDGMLLTAKHVVVEDPSDCNDPLDTYILAGIYKNDEIYPAENIYCDDDLDIALIKLIGYETDKIICLNPDALVKANDDATGYGYPNIYTGINTASGNILKDSIDFFIHNSHLLKGMSGGPVCSRSSNDLLGVISHGNERSRYIRSNMIVKINKITYDKYISVKEKEFKSKFSYEDKKILIDFLDRFFLNMEIVQKNAKVEYLTKDEKENIEKRKDKLQKNIRDYINENHSSDLSVNLRIIGLAEQYNSFSVYFRDLKMFLIEKDTRRMGSSSNAMVFNDNMDWYYDTKKRINDSKMNILDKLKSLDRLDSLSYLFKAILAEADYILKEHPGLAKKYICRDFKGNRYQKENLLYKLKTTIDNIR